MQSKTKKAAAADKAAQPQIPGELLDQLVIGPMTAGQAQGLFDRFKKFAPERVKYDVVDSFGKLMELVK